MKAFFRVTAIIILFINALGALWGGGGLISDPSGTYMLMPEGLLEHSPFDNYLIPGIILFIANGLFSIYTLYLVFTRHPLYSRFIFLQGIILTMWMTIQVALLQIFHMPLHLPFFLMGVFLVIAGIVLTKFELKA